MSRRVALVHDWLTGFRGGEKVLDALVQLYPDAEIFTLIHVKNSTSPRIEARPIRTSFLQRLPNSQTHYRRYLPLFPLAIESLDLRNFDLVISTSHAVAKGCKPAPGAVHISYVHTPMRYVWDQFDAYFGKGRAGVATRIAANLTAPMLRRWDVASTNRIDRIIANSQFVSRRCERFWGRAADAVVYPPVELERFTPAADLTREDRSSQGYALIVSALVPYKRVDLAIRAFSKLGRRLIVAGGGPELSKLSNLVNAGSAGSNIQILGPVSDEKLVELYRRCAFFILSGEEDFGIAPVEAQACGRPVLALGRGGALETVRAEDQAGSGSEPTGVFFGEPAEESLIEALPAIDRLAAGIDPQAIRAWSEQFSAARFGPELSAALARFL